MERLPRLDHLADVVELVRRDGPVYARVSKGPLADERPASVDHVSGLEMPGLSVNPLSPPAWWRDRPLDDWVARQLCTYLHLADDERLVWVLRGREVDRGPDNEPLVVDVEPLAEVSGQAVREAEARHGAHRSDRDEDDAVDGKAPWTHH